MEIMKSVILVVTFSASISTNSFAQTFENAEKAKSFFYSLDDSFNVAMSTKDSAFFVVKLINLFVFFTCELCSMGNKEPQYQSATRRYLIVIPKFKKIKIKV